MAPGSGAYCTSSCDTYCEEVGSDYQGDVVRGEATPAADGKCDAYKTDAAKKYCGEQAASAAKASKAADDASPLAMNNGIFGDSGVVYSKGLEDLHRRHVPKASREKPAPEREREARATRDAPRQHLSVHPDPNPGQLKSLPLKAALDGTGLGCAGHAHSRPCAQELARAAEGLDACACSYRLKFCVAAARPPPPSELWVGCGGARLGRSNAPLSARHAGSRSPSVPPARIATCPRLATDTCWILEPEGGRGVVGGGLVRGRRIVPSYVLQHLSHLPTDSRPTRASLAQTSLPPPRRHSWASLRPPAVSRVRGRVWPWSLSVSCRSQRPPTTDSTYKNSPKYGFYALLR